MHRTSLAVLLSALPVFAQNWYVPDSNPGTGNCNVIPYGQPSPGPFSNARIHMRLLAADLGATVNLITGLGFAACSSGLARFDSIEIVLDHIPPAQPLSTTWASNLTPAAVTVLSATDYTWHVTASTWNEIGLQNLFVYNGVDDVVVQITTTDALAPGGFLTGNRQRIYWIDATSTTPPPSGFSDNAAPKIEASMLMARTSRHGTGCAGSSGTPAISFTGSPVQGNTISLVLANGLPTNVALLVAGVTNAFPLPLDLGFLGAPGCFAWTDLTATAVVITDAAGSASTPVAVPPGLVGFRFYAQYAVFDAAANPAGLTTTGYLHVLTGN